MVNRLLIKHYLNQPCLMGALEDMPPKSPRSDVAGLQTSLQLRSSDGLV